MTNDKFLKSWLEGTVSSEEIKAKNDEDGFKELEEIIIESSKLQVPNKTSKEEAWKQFLSNTEQDFLGKADQIEDRKINKPFTRNLWLPLSIAASIIIFVVAYINLGDDSTIISADNGSQLAYTLPDGSEILLNANSTIEFDSDEWAQERTVIFSGEAFFDVKPGIPFVVKGDHGKIEVMGTSFNAQFRKSKLTVSCFTGSVRVNSNDENITLTALQQTVLKNNSLTDPVKFDPVKIASWKKGQFYFENTPLIEVIAELERQYNVEVKHSNLEDRLYTGYFDNNNLDEALTLVFKPMSLEYTKTKSLIIVK